MSSESPERVDEVDRVAPESCPRVLVVEDDERGRELLTALLEDEGYAVDAFESGESALVVLQEEPDRYDAVLLDWMLPGLDGMQVLTRIKGTPRLQLIPVILQTARDDRRDILEGLAAGAYYYLTKPLDTEMVRSTVDVAVRDHARCRELHGALRRGVESIGLAREATFTIRTVDQVPGLATLLSHLADEPETAAVGIGELLINGIEHGNLGITYEEKSRLLREDRWDDEVARRSALPENEEKVVTVHVTREEKHFRLEIRDEGPGFPWEEFLTISPERAFHQHGRGIAMARMMSFESLEYHPPGNAVTAVVRAARLPSGALPPV